MRGFVSCLCVAALLGVASAITGAAPRARPSHCPQVYSYDPAEPDSTRLSANIQLKTDNTLRGFTVNISFNHPVGMLGNKDVGEVTTRNNKDFTITSKRRLKPGPPLTLHIFANHLAGEPPSITSIKLDDRVICASEHVWYELEPRRTTARVGESIIIVGHADVPLSLCRFQFPPTMRHVDLSAGAATPGTSEYEYVGAGLAKGDCGIRLKYVRDDMDGLVQSTIQAVEKDEEEMAATTLRVISSRGDLPVFNIIPRRATLTPGDNLTVSCNTDHPINMCHIYLPGGRYLNFDLGSGSAQSGREHSYHGTGLRNGHCGVRLSRVDERLNGFIVCKVGMWPESTSGAWETDAMYVQTKYPVYQTEPRRILARPGEKVTILGRYPSGPIDICHFYYPPTRQLVDLSRGHQTPPTSEYEYHGAGLEVGECGITLKRVHDGMDGLVESKVKSVDKSILENCATTLRVTTVKKSRLPVFRIRPKRASLKAGENITITCNADRSIDMCTIFLPGPLKLNFDRGADSVATAEYRYHGTGLRNGHCGVTLTRVTERLNGFVVCKVGHWPESTIGAWETDSLQVRTSDEAITLGADHIDEDEEEEEDQNETTSSSAGIVPSRIHDIDYRTPGSETVYSTTRTPSRGEQRTPSTTRTPIRGEQRTPSTSRTPSRGGQRTPATTQRPVKTAVECGRVQTRTVPLITQAQGTYRGQWPWHGALYISTETGSLQYMCGGSLIGPRAMVTAAHCVTQGPFDRPAKPATLNVFLGKYHLLQWSENGVQEKRVEEVVVHPEYNRTGFRNDIAVLTFVSPVEMTDYVRPVCLWDEHKKELSEVEGKEGTVVGWGFDETGQLSQELMMATMPVVSYSTCVFSNPTHYTQFASATTYCAGFRNGTSVCNGDSGGGMTFPTRSRDNTVTWYLRGLTSNSLPKKVGHVTTNVCDPQSYVVFTDVAQYLDWLKLYVDLE